MRLILSIDSSPATEGIVVRRPRAEFQSCEKQTFEREGEGRRAGLAGTASQRRSRASTVVLEVAAFSIETSAYQPAER